MANIMRLGGGAGGVELNIDYGTTPPTDTSKLWVPLAKKPNYVEINGEFTQYGQEYDTVWDGVSVIPNTMTYGWKPGDTVGYNGELYIFGGEAGSGNYTTNKILIYNTATKSTRYSAVNLPASTGRLSAVRIGTIVYLFGGSRPGSTSSTFTNVYAYHLDTDKIEDTGISTGGIYNSIAVARGDLIYVLAGKKDSNNLTSIWIIDTVGKLCYDSGISIPSTYQYNGSYCSRHGYAGADGCLWVLYATGSTSFLYKVNVDTGEFTTVCSLNSDVHDGVAHINGKIYAASKKDGMYIVDIASGTSYTKPISSNTVYACEAVDLSVFYVEYASDYVYHIREFVVETLLEENHLKVFTDMYAKQTALINDKNCKLYATVREAFIGNEDGYAREVDACIYDEDAAEWKNVDGESVTQDMLTALAELGVT